MNMMMPVVTEAGKIKYADDAKEAKKMDKPHNIGAILFFVPGYGVSMKNIDQAIKFVYSDNNSLSVIFHDNDLLMGVVGEFNKNLKELERITKSNLYSRGNSILIKSTPDTNEVVKNAIQFLANQFINNGNIENKDILSSIDKFMINEKVKNQNVTDIIKTPKKSIIPRSEKQKNYVRALRESDIIISCGPAGTGKTFLAVAVGVRDRLWRCTARKPVAVCDRISPRL